MDTIERTVSVPPVEAAPTHLGRRLPASRLSILLDLVLIWMERARQRRALQALDDRLLRDIGLTRADVELEASKRFWQI